MNGLTGMHVATLLREQKRNNPNAQHFHPHRPGCQRTRSPLRTGCPGAPLIKAPGQGPASADSVSLVLGSHKGSIIKGLSRGSLLRLQLPAPFIWQQWGGLSLWVNCLPLQLMNLCGLSFVCFPGVRINGRPCTPAARERGKEKDAGTGRPGEEMRHVTK